MLTCSFLQQDLDVQTSAEPGIPFHEKFDSKTAVEASLHSQPVANIRESCYLLLHKQLLSLQHVRNFTIIGIKWIRSGHQTFHSLNEATGMLYLANVLTEPAVVFGSFRMTRLFRSLLK